MLHVSTLRDVVNFMRSAPSYLSKSDDVADLDQWYKEQITAAVNAMMYWYEGDLEILTSIVYTYGVQCLSDM
jgi:hypothetical protein